MIWFVLFEVLLVLALGFFAWKSRFRFHNFIQRFEKKSKSLFFRHGALHLHLLLTSYGLGRSQANSWIQKRWAFGKTILLLGAALFLITGDVICFFIPVTILLLDYYLVLRSVRVRQDKILRRIPFVLDMLILNLQSGLDFVSSLEELTQIKDNHPLHDEIRITLQSIHVGETRTNAFKNLGIRTQVQELTNLAGVIQQSEVMGTSLIEALELQSKEIRHRVFKQAEAEAQKAPVKILIPMLLFIFPIVFILLFVPIGIQLLDNFR